MKSNVKISKTLSHGLVLHAVFVGPMVGNYWHKMGKLVESTAELKLDTKLFGEAGSVKYEHDAQKLFDFGSTFFFALDSALGRSFSSQQVRLDSVSFEFMADDTTVVFTHEK